MRSALICLLLAASWGRADSGDVHDAVPVGLHRAEDTSPCLGRRGPGAAPPTAEADRGTYALGPPQDERRGSYTSSAYSNCQPIFGNFEITMFRSLCDGLDSGASSPLKIRIR